MKILLALVLIVFGLVVAIGSGLLISYEWALVAHWFWNDYITKYFSLAPMTFKSVLVGVLGIGVIWDIMATSAMARLKSAKNAATNVLLIGILGPILIYVCLKIAIWFFVL